LHHRAYRAVFFFRKANSRNEGFLVNSDSGDDVMDSNRGENLGGTFCLVGLNAHLIPGNLLVIFLTEYGDDIKGRAPGETHRNQFDWFRPSAASGIVQDQIVAASSTGQELTLLSKCLCKLDVGCNHKCPLAKFIGKEHE
jgi:hypothetical protein